MRAPRHAQRQWIHHVNDRQQKALCSFLMHMLAAFISAEVIGNPLLVSPSSSKSAALLVSMQAISNALLVSAVGPMHVSVKALWHQRYHGGGDDSEGGLNSPQAGGKCWHPPQLHSHPKPVSKRSEFAGASIRSPLAMCKGLEGVLLSPSGGGSHMPNQVASRHMHCWQIPTNQWLVRKGSPEAAMRGGR
jgi:hypothetical protein